MPDWVSDLQFQIQNLKEKQEHGELISFVYTPDFNFISEIDTQFERVEGTRDINDWALYKFYW